MNNSIKSSHIGGQPLVESSPSKVATNACSHSNCHAEFSSASRKEGQEILNQVQDDVTLYTRHAELVFILSCLGELDCSERPLPSFYLGLSHKDIVLAEQHI